MKIMYIGDDGSKLKRLFGSFKKLSNIQEITVDILTPELRCTEKSFRKLITTIQTSHNMISYFKNFKFSLQRQNLHLYSMEKFLDVGIFLNNISIRVDVVKGLDINKIESLFAYMHAFNLKVLELDVSVLDETKGDIELALVNFIKRIKNLEGLKLNFDCLPYSSNITNQLFINLGNSIRSLTKLQRVDLSFKLEQLEDYSKEDERYLLTSFEKLLHLRSLKFKCKPKGSICSKIVEEFYESIAYLPYLSNVAFTQ